MDPSKQYLSPEPPPCTEEPEASLCQNEQPLYATYYNCVPSQHPQTIYPQEIPASAYEGHPTGHLPSSTNGQQVQTTIAMTQPGRCFPAEIYSALPPNYLGLSLFSCLCCFWPLGLAALILSCQVDDAVRRGDMAGAHNNSRIAKILAFSSIVVGFALISILLVLKFTV